MESKINQQIVRYTDDVEVQMTDLVVTEYHLQLIINDKNFLSLLCTPEYLQELSIGFLYTQGIIKDWNEIKEIMIDETKGVARITLLGKDTYTFIDNFLCCERTVTTACGKGRKINYPMDTKESQKVIQLEVDKKTVLNLCKEFNKMSELFKQTGGVHSCAIADDNSILIMKEDIGRHNALDKVIGHALIKNINLEDKMLITSGRVTSEIMEKVIICGIPVIVSRSAPSDMAIRLANKYGILLIGFARGKRMNVYL